MVVIEGVFLPNVNSGVWDCVREDGVRSGIFVYGIVISIVDREKQ